MRAFDAKCKAHMDFFVIIFLVFEIVSNSGQNNYAVGNMFQDVLGQHRIRRGQTSIMIRKAGGQVELIVHEGIKLFSGTMQTSIARRSLYQI
jgi:hypothetical protein